MKHLALPLVLLSFATIALSIPETSIVIDSSGMIKYSAVSIGRYLLEHWRLSAELYAEKTDMYMCHVEVGPKVQEIHSIRPDLICLLYRNIRAVYQSADEYQTFLQNDWILKDADGARIHSTNYSWNWIVDPGNPHYQQWIANWIKTNLDKYGFNGVFLDNCLPSYQYMWSTTPGPPINPRTGQQWTSQEFKEAVITLVNKVKDTIAPKLVIGNGILDGQTFFDNYHQNYVELLDSRIDGVMSEGWISDWSSQAWYSEDKWRASIDFVVWLEDYFLPGGKIFVPVCANAATGNLPPGCTEEQYSTYCFASLLLAARTSSHYVNFYYYMVEDYPQSLFNIELGTPLGSYYVVSGTHVYARDWTKVKVLVNPTYQPYTITLDGQYTTLDGTPVPSSITLNPHTATILKS